MNENKLSDLQDESVNRRRFSQAGFTLIELVIVVIVLGILGAIAIPQFVDVTDRAKITSYASNVQNAVRSVTVKATRDGGVVSARTDGPYNCSFGGYDIITNNTTQEIVDGVDVSGFSFTQNEENNGSDRTARPTETVAEFDVPVQYKAADDFGRGPLDCYITKD